MTKRFAAFFFMAAFSFALMAGVYQSQAGDLPPKVVSLSSMTDAERQQAMLQTGN